MAIASQTLKSNSDSLVLTTLHLYVLLRHYHTREVSEWQATQPAYKELDRAGWLFPAYEVSSEEKFDKPNYDRILSEQAITFVKSLTLAPKPVAVTRWVIPVLNQQTPNVAYYKVPILVEDKEKGKCSVQHVFRRYEELDASEQAHALRGDLEIEYRAE
jgi:hypothetical protein